MGSAPRLVINANKVALLLSAPLTTDFYIPNHTPYCKKKTPTQKGRCLASLWYSKTTGKIISIDFYLLVKYK